MVLWVTIGLRVRISPVLPLPPMSTERDPTYCHQVSLRATKGRLVDSRTSSPHMILKATTVFFCQHLRKHKGQSHTCHQQRSFARSTRVGCWGTPQPALVRHFSYKWMNERAALGVSYSCGLFKALSRFKAKTTTKTLTPHSNQMLILSRQKWQISCMPWAPWFRGRWKQEQEPVGVASSSALDNGSLRWTSSPTQPCSDLSTLCFPVTPIQILPAVLHWWWGGTLTQWTEPLPSLCQGLGPIPNTTRKQKIETDMPMSPNWTIVFSKVRSWL